MTFSVGDRVRYVKDGCLDWERSNWGEQAGCVLGGVYTISETSEDDRYVSIEEDTLELSLSPEHFELIEEDRMFKVGDRVHLSKDSEFFGDNNSNPDSEDEIGTITHVHDENHIHVAWHAGYDNGYRSSDLILYKGEDMLDTSEMYTRINRDHVQAGDTEIIKATRRRKGHSQYIVRYQGSSQRIATVRHCDIPKLVAALLDMYDGRV